MLDDQELEQIHRLLSKSFYEHRKITIKLFDEFDDIEFQGIVTAIQSFRKEIKLATNKNDWKWIKIDDIMGIL